jgi:hypothetical protein
MLSKKFALLGLAGFSATSILFSNAAIAQTVNQELNGRAIGPETFVDISNFTVNPTGTLNQKIDCEARNETPIDPRCDGRNTAIYGSPNTHFDNNSNSNNNSNTNDNGNNNSIPPNLNQNVSNGGTNTTVITPNTATSNSNSSSNANATVTNSGNSKNTNSSTSTGGNASSGASVGNISTGGTSVSPSTKVKVDGDQHNSIQFGNQAPGTGGEAFSFQYRSACGTSVGYRQGFALKPKRIGGGGLGFALDISSTDMDTIDNRSGVQRKMDSAFETAVNVVDTQQAFEKRLNVGTVSLEEAQTRAVANCAPTNTAIRNQNTERKVFIQSELPEKPRTCTARGCN